MKCPECDSEMESTPPRSAMREPMYGRGVDNYECTNPRCRYFGVKQ